MVKSHNHNKLVQRLTSLNKHQHHNLSHPFNINAFHVEHRKVQFVSISSETWIWSLYIKMHHTGLFTQVHKQKSLSLLIYDPGIVIRKNNSLSGSAVSSPSIWITEWNRFALHSHTTKHNQGGLHTLYEQKKSTVGSGYNITHLAA